MSIGSNIELKVAVPSFLFNSIADNPNVLIDLLGEQQIGILKARIVELLVDLDGAPEVVDLKILEFKYDEIQSKGSFRLTFRISRTFCCSDISAANDDYVDFKFEFENELLRAYGNFFQWTLDN